MPKTFRGVALYGTDPTDDDILIDAELERVALDPWHNQINRLTAAYNLGIRESALGVTTNLSASSDAEDAYEQGRNAATVALNLF